MAAANHLLDKELIKNLEIYTCEVYNRATHLTQCFHCQAYGYVARACRNMTKYTYYTGEHSSGECRRADNPSKAKCANCHRAGHSAWMKVCPVCDWEIEQLQAV